MAFPKIYLDDNADDDNLILVLQAAGFTVISPRNAGTARKEDPEHLDFAAMNNYTLLTFDAGYEQWHESHLNQGKSHAGILIVYQDNDKRRDMTHAEIAKAIHNLLKQCPPFILENNVHRLNAWRY